jgi:hypothetical protein
MRKYVINSEYNNEELISRIIKNSNDEKKLHGPNSLFGKYEMVNNHNYLTFTKRNPNIFYRRGSDKWMDIKITNTEKGSLIEINVHIPVTGIIIFAIIIVIWIIYSIFAAITNWYPSLIMQFIFQVILLFMMSQLKPFFKYEKEQFLKDFIEMIK